MMYLFADPLGNCTIIFNRSINLVKMQDYYDTLTYNLCFLCQQHSVILLQCYQGPTTISPRKFLHLYPFYCINNDHYFVQIIITMEP